MLGGENSHADGRGEGARWPARSAGEKSTAQQKIGRGAGAEAPAPQQMFCRAADFSPAADFSLGPASEYWDASNLVLGCWQPSPPIILATRQT